MTVGDGSGNAGASASPTPEQARQVLAGLANALFPGGDADLTQLTWDSERPQPRPSPLAGGETDAGHELRTADLRYRTLVEQIPAVTFLAVLGEGDNEIYVSPYIEALLGFTQQEWLENPFLWYNQLHPEDRQLWHDEFTRGIQTGGPFHAECRFIARDGRVVWVRGEARLVKDEIGRPLFLQGVAFDITESKRTHTLELQEAVRSTEQRYRDLVEHLDAIFFEVEAATGKFTFVSGGVETILGFGSQVLRDDPNFWLTRIHPDDREAARRHWTAALAAGGEHEFEIRAHHADSREIWLHISMQAPALDTPQRYLIGFMLNVTERKRAEVERTALLEAAQEARRIAESANRAKDEFLATMSHELKTPLNALIGYAQLLRAQQMPPELKDKALESIERNALMQARLVEDLLDVSRLMTGKLHLDVKPVDLVHVIDAAFDTVRLAANAKRIALNTRIEGSGLIVAGDASRLQQVVWNLLSNAVKFTPEDGNIDVELERAGRYARIRVSDTGIGIPSHVLPHVFERFRQGDSSLTRQHGGMGIGLTIVRQLVELHGGHVHVESDGADRGTTFTVTLPLAGSPAGSPEANHEQASLANALHGIRIVVVDDDRDSRELLHTVFTQAGAEVTTAGSAAQAERALRDGQAHILVCDVGMPEEDGYHLIGRLRANGMWRAELPAVAITAYTGEPHRRRALAAGFDEHVPKPVDIGAIVNLVARLVGRAGPDEETRTA